MADKPPSLANRKGYGHLAFEVDDVAEMLAKVLAHGGSAIGCITEKEVPMVGTITVVYVADPEDNIIELQSWR
jgi:catechol 2,3-dioxygenase-like lactoylglutathione lyase family enzyme